jgi:hypothetical protein
MLAPWQIHIEGRVNNIVYYTRPENINYQTLKGSLVTDAYKKYYANKILYKIAKDFGYAQIIGYYKMFGFDVIKIDSSSYTVDGINQSVNDPLNDISKYL